MNFWDRFVLRVYLGFVHTLPVGRDTAAGLFDFAYGRERLATDRLSDGSLLLLLAGAGRDAPVRAAALAEAVRRQLPRRPDDVRRWLATLRPARADDLLEINRPHEAHTAQLVANALTSPPGDDLWVGLMEFLGRLYRTQPVAQRTLATRLLLEAVRLYHAKFPRVGTVNFPPLLYRHVLGRLGVGARRLPNTQGEPVPVVDEQTFLDRCGIFFSDVQQVFLFLHCYARLDVEQLAEVLRYTDDSWTADLVSQELNRLWRHALH